MAASSVSLSRSWITNLVIFDNLINANIPNYDDLDCCVTLEAKNGVLRGLKQLNYWRDKLQSLVSQHIIIFSCMTPSGIVKPDLHDFKMQITRLIGKGKILSIYYPENTNFIGFVFQEAGVAQIVRQGVTHIAGAPVCFVDKKENNEHFIHLLWTPYNFPLNNITSALDKFCTKVTIDFEKTRFEDGDIVPSNILSGSIILKEGVTINTLPHILKVKHVTDQYILLVVKGRPPICLRCRRIGHIRRQCPDRKCFKCLSLHASDKHCKIRSYASVTNNSASLEEDMVVNEGLDYPNDDSTKTVFDSNKRDILENSNGDFSNTDFVDNSSGDKGCGALIDFKTTTTISENKKKYKRARKGKGRKADSELHVDFSQAVDVPDPKKKKTTMTENSCFGASSDMKEIEKIDSETEASDYDEGEQDISPISSIEASIGTDDLHESIHACSIDSLLPALKSEDTDIASEHDNICLDEEDKVSKSDSDIEVDLSLLKDIRLVGFKIGTSISEVFQFLGSPTPKEVWINLNGKGCPDGTYGATYDTPEEALSVYQRQREVHKNQTIHFTRFTTC